MFDDIVLGKKRTKKVYICNCRICGYTKTCDDFFQARDYIIAHLMMDHQMSVFDDSDIAIVEEEIEENLYE